MTEKSFFEFIRIREALEASWDTKTSYLAGFQPGNPAFGQCYPTARLVQHFFPGTEIIKGEVWNGKAIETHFWNGLVLGDQLYHIDLTWQQFPFGSSVRVFKLLDRNELNDSPQTIERCELLRQRVLSYLSVAA